MVEEVVWGNVIWFGVGGWALRGDTGRVIDADFYVMHLVTSSIFLLAVILPGGSPLRELLPLRQRLLLLRTIWPSAPPSIYHVAGRSGAAHQRVLRRHADIRRTTPPAATPRIRVGRSDDGVGTRGPATSSRDHGIHHIDRHRAPDEHFPKTIRALAAFAARWGMRTSSAHRTAGSSVARSAWTGACSCASRPWWWIDLSSGQRAITITIRAMRRLVGTIDLEIFCSIHTFSTPTACCR
ncbi:hypothetical protein BC826DRAFT_111828 [Russula brevipes]|nr:hypothetical protein BC826DRAFT_111828 [Russula brevipes]